ncbi:MAG: HNH endonuclease [Candidatus Latescibacterota bacterium]|nr:MAG: HNH endonuclease [Candidatus Latescibacterota bacterium]
MSFRAIPGTPEKYAEYLRWLRSERNKNKNKERPERQRLTAAQRKRILSKTGARCHICGGKIKDRWQADHVFPHSAGGGSCEDNYLAAHALCNNYRWDYTAEEFRQVLKLGVWARTQIDKETPVGQRVAKGFMSSERARRRRRNRG